MPRTTWESSSQIPSAPRQIGPVNFVVCDEPIAVDMVLCALRDGPARVFAFCNMNTYNLALRIPALVHALHKATVFNDGLGMDVASRVLHGERFPTNLNGTDFMPALLAALPQSTRVFLVGSPPGVVEVAAKALQARFSAVDIVGCHHGYFRDEETSELAARINAAGTRLLVVGMGNPRQEIWADEIAERVGAVVICVGAFLDFTAGRIARAPLFVRRLRLEWLYRMALEPRRLTRRYVGGAPVFLWSIVRQKLGARNAQFL